jgi:eukaryotic-like serine/threonine-protein kinase
MLNILKPGDILRERYRILDMIGQGGMGSIYQAEDIRLEGRITAIKQIDTDLNGPSQDVEQTRIQFQREASTLARLDHPNLPKVSDYFTENGRDFLVMDFVPGYDLRQVIDKANRSGEFLPERQVLEWARQIMDALAYLHAQEPPVLHRDIKPGNIKVTPGGTIKLVDFGLVKVMSPDQTRTITIVQGRGTAYYTPLEQYGEDAGHTDARSDLYSFGATLYHLLTNRPPIEAKQRFLTPSALLRPSEVNQEVSERTERAVLWAMSMHPDDRPLHVHALRDAMLGHGRIPSRVFRAGLANARLTQDNGEDAEAFLATGNIILAVIATILLAIAVVLTLA